MADTHPDLLYIQITAWATVALVFATIFMIWWQIRASKKLAEVQLTMRLTEQYDSPPMRANRQALAVVLLNGSTPSSRAVEPITDLFEGIGVLYFRGRLDIELVENSFSVPVRYWWAALESHIATARGEYHDTSLYEEFQRLAVKYNDAELVRRRVPPLSTSDLRVFLKSEAS